MKPSKTGILFSLLLCSLIAVGAFTALPTNAQEEPRENGNRALITKLDELVDALQALVANSGDDASDDAASPGVALQYAHSVSNPSCIDNYQSWPNSLVRKTDSTWDPSLIPPTVSTGYYGPHRNFIDLNGDGLNDYVYWESNFRQYNPHYHYNQIQGCVLLNNGAGWDTAYKCVTQSEGSTSTGYDIRYYGDCAQI